MKKIIQYQTVSALNVAVFDNHVNELLKQGYQPLNAVSVVMTSVVSTRICDTTRWTQTMVKYEETAWNSPKS